MKRTVNSPIQRREILRGTLALGVLGWLQGCAWRPGGKAHVLWPDQEPRSATSVAAGPTPWSVSPEPSIPAGPGPRPTATGYYALPSNVIPRREWTNQGIIMSRLTSNGQDGKMGRISRITIHHDAMESGAIRSRGDAMKRMQTIRTGHISRPGEPFADIGYHFAIDPQGRIWEGRPLAYQGAHVKGQNENNLGIVLMGNFDAQRPSATSIGTLDAFVVQQMQRYGISITNVRTHQEMAPTACPGRNLQRYLMASRSRGGNIARA